jgi:serine/threonine protein kinase
VEGASSRSSVLRFFENVNETEWVGEKYAMEVFRDVGSESVKQEFEILTSLSHPHVLRLVCWSEDRRRNDCSLVMELMEEDLQSFLMKLSDDSGSNLSHDTPAFGPCCSGSYASSCTGIKIFAQ